MINFICGCRSKIDPPITEEIFRTFDSVVYDHEGFIMCQIHHARRSGWRSVPYTTMTRPYVPRDLLTADEIKACEAKKMWPQYDTCNWAPLELERWEVFGEFPKWKSVEVENSEIDLRDNRDPEDCIPVNSPREVRERVREITVTNSTLIAEAGRNPGRARPLLQYQRELAMDSMRP